LFVSKPPFLCFSDDAIQFPEPVPCDGRNFQDVVSSKTAETTKKRRLKFSEMWKSFIIENQFPREPVQQFIADLKREDPVWDVQTMPVSWRALAKITKSENEAFGFIQDLSISNDAENTNEDNEDDTEEPTARSNKVLPNCKQQYCHFGLRRTLSKYLDVILAETFPNGKKPSRPHFWIDLWCDGAPLTTTGHLNKFWPVAFSILSVGESVDGPHTPVPGHIAQPLILGMFLGEKKPTSAYVFLREAVDELKILDPRPRDDRPCVNLCDAVSYTVSLKRCMADTPARAFMKAIKSHGSLFFCEKCLAMGTKAGGTCTSIYRITDLPLRKDADFLKYEEHLQRVSVNLFCLKDVGEGI
jgi:hypothetical protein